MYIIIMPIQSRIISGIRSVEPPPSFAPLIFIPLGRLPNWCDFFGDCECKLNKMAHYCF